MLIPVTGTEVAFSLTEITALIISTEESTISSKSNSPVCSMISSGSILTSA